MARRLLLLKHRAEHDEGGLLGLGTTFGSAGATMTFVCVATTCRSGDGARKALN